LVGRVVNALTLAAALEWGLNHFSMDLVERKFMYCGGHVLYLEFEGFLANEVNGK
jgi:hypothetical protein